VQTRQSLQVFFNFQYTGKEMKFRFAFLSGLLAIGLSGCSSVLDRADREARMKQLDTPVEERVEVPFDEAQAKAAMLPGDAAIHGVLYHKVKNGGKYAGEDALLTLNPAVFVTGVDVYLYPVTDHLLELNRLEDDNRKRFKLGWVNEKKQLKKIIPDPRIHKYARVTKTDSSGRYAFQNLKPGRYYVYVDPQNVITTGTEAVRSGTSVVSDGWGVLGSVAHYQDRDFRVKTMVEYAEFVDVAEGKKEVRLESRMRHRRW
jgi:hypothetical protein